MTAYQAERSAAAGLRIFIHPSAMQNATEPFINDLTIGLPNQELSASSTHELRLWRDHEARPAQERLRAFASKQELSARAREHYQRTDDAYARFSAISTDLPFTLPAIWL